MIDNVIKVLQLNERYFLPWLNRTKSEVNINELAVTIN